MQQQNTHYPLTTTDLTVGYRSKKSKQAIVSQISIAIEQGALVGLIGINGSGKSTLLRTLAGLQKPLEGTLHIAGKAINNLTVQALAQQLSVVLTNQPLSKNLSVLELVSLGRLPYANWLGGLDQSDTAAINAALLATDCVTFKDKRCHELSDGQMQRVHIARALAQDTPIILLDEPLSHLDLHHKAALLKLLQKIAHDQHKTIVFSSHDIEHILPLCDRLLLLKEGRCIDGSPQELVADGVFDSLFPSEHITFNAATGRFSIDN